MYSMTGYGKGEWKGETCDLTIEIKTVNNRYLDIALKAPKSFLAYEETIRSRIKEKMTRGHVDVFVTYTDRRETKQVVRVDVALARSYLEAARTLSAELDVPQDVTTSYLMKCPDVVRTEESAEEDERITQALDYALDEALTRLNEMRAVEGKKLEEDLLSRMETIEKIVSRIRTRAPLVAEEYRKRLEERLRAYLADVEPDESRLLTEVALFTDKCNIDEELTRLTSHIAQFRSIAKTDLVGRKLDFLVQEFNRETNTICSKSNDLTITECGLSMKNEIEKVREQVQNLE